MANPARVQNWSAQSAAATSVASLAVTLGNGGSGSANPTAGNLLAMFVIGSNMDGTHTIGTPSSWTAGGTVNSGTISGTNYTGCSLFLLTAPGGSVSVTVTPSSNMALEVFAFELSNAVFDVEFSASTTSSTTIISNTGSGTSNATNELQLLCFGTSDAILGNGTVSGFTFPYSGLGNHGDGSASFGNTGTVAYATSLTASTTISAQSMTWSGDTGVFGNVGMVATFKSPPGGVVLPNYEAGTAHYTGGLA